MKALSCLVKALYICVSYASSTYNTLRNFRRCRVRRLFLYCFHYVHARWPVISFHGQGNYSLVHRVVALTAPAAAAAASVPGELLRSRLSTTRHVYNTPTENAGLLFSRSSFFVGRRKHTLSPTKNRQHIGKYWCCKTKKNEHIR